MQTVSRTEVNQMIRRGKGSLSLRKYAEKIGVSVAYLSDILRNRRDPGPPILAMLRLRKVKTTTIVYERVGRKAVKP